MRPAAESPTVSIALLTIEAAESGYAIPAASVLAVEHLSDWTGEPPLDALALLGLAEAETEAQTEARVAVLDAGGHRFALLVRGKLTLIHPKTDELLALPSAMQSLAPLVSHVAVVSGKPAFFVLSPVRLARARSALPRRPLPIPSR
jgi:hypothetical protein